MTAPQIVIIKVALRVYTPISNCYSRLEWLHTHQSLWQQLPLATIQPVIVTVALSDCTPTSHWINRSVTTTSSHSNSCSEWLQALFIVTVALNDYTPTNHCNSSSEWLHPTVIIQYLWVTTHYPGIVTFVISHFTPTSHCNSSSEWLHTH